MQLQLYGLLKKCFRVTRSFPVIFMLPLFAINVSDRDVLPDQERTLMSINKKKWVGNYKLSRNQAMSMLMTVAAEERN